jgi:hypothetical protein
MNMAHEVMILPVSAPVTMHPGALGSIDGISSCLPLIVTTLHLLLHSLTHSLTYLNSNYIRFLIKINFVANCNIATNNIPFCGVETFPNIRQQNILN